MRAMAKKKGPGRPKGPDKVALYLEIPPDLKDRLDALARANYRTLTAECMRIFEEALARHEAGKEGGAE